MSEPIKTSIDFTAAGATIGALLGILPAVAALFAAVWYAVQIMESKTVQGWLEKARQRPQKPAAPQDKALLRLRLLSLLTKLGTLSAALGALASDIGQAILPGVPHLPALAGVGAGLVLFMVGCTVAGLLIHFIKARIEARANVVPDVPVV